MPMHINSFQYIRIHLIRVDKRGGRNVIDKCRGKKISLRSVVNFFAAPENSTENTRNAKTRQRRKKKCNFPA